MNKITNQSELEALIQEQSMCLVFIKTENCGVCDVVLDKTNRLMTKYPQIDSLLVYMHENPDVSSAYLVFTAPTILLFIEGKEVYRASRFVVMGELEDTIRMWYEQIFS